MKSKDWMMIIGGGIAAYMLFPQVKEVAADLPGGGGGSSGGSTILDFMPDFKFPEISIINELPGVKEIIEVVKEAPENIPDPTDLVPGGGGVPDPQEVIDYFVDLVGGGGHEEPGIPNPLDLLGGSGLGLFGELKEKYERYVENFKGGILGFADFGDFVTGGWQDKFDSPNPFDIAKYFVGTDAYRAQNLLTDYAKAVGERGTRAPAPSSGQIISSQDAKPQREYAGPGYQVIKPMKHPGIPGVAIVGVLRGSPTPIGSIGLKPPPTKAERWMFT